MYIITKPLLYLLRSSASSDTKVNLAQASCATFITARVRMFYRCLPVNTGGGGFTHLHSIILPLVPCPFQGYHSDWSQVRSRGYQVIPRQGLPPCQAWGTPPARSGWNTPSAMDEVFLRPPIRICLDRLCHVLYASCSSAGGLSCFFVILDATRVVIRSSFLLT